MYGVIKILCFYVDKIGFKFCWVELFDLIFFDLFYKDVIGVQIVFVFIEDGWIVDDVGFVLEMDEC